MITDRIKLQPCLRHSLGLIIRFPSNELLGYCQMSLRDRKSTSFG